MASFASFILLPNSHIMCLNSFLLLDWGCKWNKGDVVGVLVDMDSKRVSFTLNGKGEEIGMGTAFSDEGFRPSGGVYAYVCLSRCVNILCIRGFLIFATSLHN